MSKPVAGALARTLEKIIFLSSTRCGCRPSTAFVRPANLIARDAVEAQVIAEELSDTPDLLRAGQRAKEVSLVELNARAAQLAAQLEPGSRQERQVFDALELSVAFALPELADFQPVVPWHFESVSEKQADSPRSFGIDPASVRNRGQGSLILKDLYARRVAGLATYRQLRFLIRFEVGSCRRSHLAECVFVCAHCGFSGLTVWSLKTKSF